MSSNSSWWWSSASGGAQAEFDKVLESCTSSNLPSSTPPPITDSLTLSDLIRSSAVTAANAIKSLEKRLNHSNPNVQLLAISVIDICIKNGGDGFLKEVGTSQFSDDCVEIIRRSSSNRDVMEKLKREFQNWALAFEAVPFLASSDLVTNYRKLKSLGIDFPPKDPSATAAMVDSMSAPEWRDSDVCERCRTAFSFTNRKHHCRNCGGVFDGQCSSKRRSLPHFGVTESVRVCDGCDRNLLNGISSNSKPGYGSGRRNSFSGQSIKSPTSKSSSSHASHHRSATFHTANYGRNSNRPGQPGSARKRREDADLEWAIALSLHDAKSYEQRARKPKPAAVSPTPQPSSFGAPSRPPINSVAEEDDPDLAAAIAASLRDMSTQPSAPLPASPSESMGKYAPEPAPKSTPLLPDPGSESINVLLNFSSEVETASRTGQLHPSNPDLRNKHANAEQGLLHFTRAIESTDRKAQQLREMNDKLSEAVRMYDRLLGEQIMYRSQSAAQPTFASVPTSNYSAPVMHNSPYHSQPVAAAPPVPPSHQHFTQPHMNNHPNVYLDQNQNYAPPIVDSKPVAQYLPALSNPDPSRNVLYNNYNTPTLEANFNSYGPPDTSTSHLQHEYHQPRNQAPSVSDSATQVSAYRIDPWNDNGGKSVHFNEPNLQHTINQAPSNPPHEAQFSGPMVSQHANPKGDLPTNMIHNSSAAPLAVSPTYSNGFSHPTSSSPQPTSWADPQSQPPAPGLHDNLASMTLAPNSLQTLPHQSPTLASHPPQSYNNPTHVVSSYSGDHTQTMKIFPGEMHSTNGLNEGVIPSNPQHVPLKENSGSPAVPMTAQNQGQTTNDAVINNLDRMFPTAPTNFPEQQNQPQHQQSSSSPTNVLPSFPSVPTGQAGWLGSSHHWETNNNHEIQTRQEEVAPLIEL